MTSKSKAIAERAMGMPIADRAALAEQLIRSLEGRPDPGVDLAWQKEIDRRLRKYRSGEAKMVTWESIRDRLRKRSRATD